MYIAETFRNKEGFNKFVTEHPDYEFVSMTTFALGQVMVIFKKK